MCVFAACFVDQLVRELLEEAVQRAHQLCLVLQGDILSFNKCSDRKVKLEIMTDIPTNRQTDKRGHREVSLPIMDCITILDRAPSEIKQVKKTCHCGS